MHALSSSGKSKVIKNDGFGEREKERDREREREREKDLIENGLAVADGRSDSRYCWQGGWFNTLCVSLILFVESFRNLRSKISGVDRTTTTFTQ